MSASTYNTTHMYIFKYAYHGKNLILTLLLPNHFVACFEFSLLIGFLNQFTHLASSFQKGKDKTIFL